MLEDKNETILAKFMSGDLTPEELAQFKSTEEFSEYQRILDGLNHFNKPAYNKEQLFQKVVKNRSSYKTPSVITLKRVSYGVISIAASVALIFGLFFNKVDYTTKFGEKLVIDLPDGSKVILNANSSLSHNRFFWKNNKEVDLIGEGYFNVQKGKGFKVNTEVGSVSVLGTEFNIKQRASNSFELICFEGKVQFESVNSKEKFILIKGDRISLEKTLMKKGVTNDSEPSWVNNDRTAFNNVKLSTVLTDIEVQYGITFNIGTIDTSVKYSGSFKHDNLDLALKTVFTPMGISYLFNKDKKEVTLLP